MAKRYKLTHRHIKNKENDMSIIYCFDRKVKYELVVLDRKNKEFFYRLQNEDHDVVHKEKVINIDDIYIKTFKMKGKTHVIMALKFQDGTEKLILNYLSINIHHEDTVEFLKEINSYFS